MRTFIVFIIFILIFNSCNLIESDENENESRKVEFHTLFKSFPTDSDIQDVKLVVLLNQDEAETFLDQFSNDFPLSSLLLNLNYSDSLVLGVFTGAKPNSNYSIEIDSIIVYRNTNQIFITEYGSASGPRAIVWPAHFISVGKMDYGNRDTINVSHECEIEPCEW